MKNKLRNKIMYHVLFYDLRLSTKEKKDLLPPYSLSNLESIWNNVILDQLRERSLEVLDDSVSEDFLDLHDIIYSFPESAFSNSNRNNYISSIGEPVIQESLLKILSEGINYRTITEEQTRSKIANANLELVKLIDSIPDDYFSNLKRFFISVGMQSILEPKSSEYYLICLWFLGLTKKGIANIVGTKNTELLNYCISYASISEVIIDNYYKNKAQLRDFIKFSTMGAQTLTIRGSMKSMSGKLFEHLILGSSLTILGYHFSNQPVSSDKYVSLSTNFQPVFWLSSTEDDNGREKDATVYYNNKIINIDIGLIGPGNPEIISDKLTRYRNEIANGTLNPTKECTIVLAGQINKGTSITRAAQDANAHVIEILNNANWMYELQSIIDEFLNYKSSVSLDNSLLEASLQTLALSKFV